MSVGSFFAAISTVVVIVSGVVALIYNDKLRASISSILLKYQKKKDISFFFKEIFPDSLGIDFLFFQLGLRKNIPITDWLYFEYVKYLNNRNKIKEFVILPTIGLSVESDPKTDFEVFCENINKLFKNLDINLNIISPHGKDFFSIKDFVNKDFISVLEYIGSKEYFDFLRENFDLKVNSISDFDRYRTTDHKIKHIFIHIYKCWTIVNYIKKKNFHNKSVNIAAIFWKWDVEKLGVIQGYSKRKSNIHFYPILGKTLKINKTTVVSDLEQETICIFDDEETTVIKAIKHIRFLKKYNSILIFALHSNVKDINLKDIKSNGKKLWEKFKVNEKIKEIKNIKKTQALFMFLGLIEKIRTIINENS